jgi:hypothetical protein
MIKVDIKKQGEVKFGGRFDDQEAADIWIEANKSFFGKEAWTETIPAVVDEQGAELEPAHQIQHPADYEIIFTDITSEIEEQNKIDRRLAKQEVGAKVIAMVTEINSSKNYSASQLQALLNDTGLFAIERLAWSGSLDLLKQSIIAYSGPFYTPDDKAKLIACIDDFFSQN